MGQRVKTYYFEIWGIHIRHFPDFSHPFVAKQWGVKGELLALRPSPAVAIQLGDLELFGAFGWFLKIQDGDPWLTKLRTYGRYWQWMGLPKQAATGGTGIEFGPMGRTSWHFDRDIFWWTITFTGAPFSIKPRWKHMFFWLRFPKTRDRWKEPDVNNRLYIDLSASRLSPSTSRRNHCAASKDFALVCNNEDPCVKPLLCFPLLDHISIFG